MAMNKEVIDQMNGQIQTAQKELQTKDLELTKMRIESNNVA